MRNTLIFCVVLLIAGVTGFLVFLYKGTVIPPAPPRISQGTYSGHAPLEVSGRDVSQTTAARTTETPDGAEAPEGRDREIPPNGERDVIPGEHVFSFYSKADRDAFIALARARGIEILGVIDFGNSVRIRTASEAELAAVLAESPEPVSRSPNYFVRKPEPVAGKDPRAPEGEYVAFGDKALAWLGVPEDNGSWGKGINVAVLDSGAGSHGTAVASLITGKGENVQGIAPGANLLGVEVMKDGSTGDTFTLASTIVDIVDAGGKVLNLSLGTYGDSSILAEAVAYAAENGAVIVASAGNDAVEGVVYPAAYDSVVAVGAIDGTGQHVYFSNRGDEVDLVAPGVAVEAATPDGGTADFTGTSASAPYVSGAIASVLSQDSSLTTDEAVEILVANADDRGAPGPDDEYGNGVLNMERVENRDVPGIYDAAIGDPYLDPDATAPTLVLYIQNRGTEEIADVDMKVNVDGVTWTVSFYGVGVGQTVSREFELNEANLQSYGNVSISCDVEINGATDSHPENNSLQTSITAQ
ncbi:MAG: S8 family serine peptidase [Kiritimatiellia bacterium]|jgi:hypothetical protein|nr:S8 family serine peptidase [Kiritimatiellia bacterium]